MNRVVPQVRPLMPVLWHVEDPCIQQQWSPEFPCSFKDRFFLQIERVHESYASKIPVKSFLLEQRHKKNTSKRGQYSVIVPMRETRTQYLPHNKMTS